MIHANLASGRWQEMSIAEQLGNVGSEYGRVLSARRRQDEARFQGALSRFLELLDMTISDKRWDLPRKRELLRLREISCQGFPESLQKYFNHFALMARNNK